MGKNNKASIITNLASREKNSWMTPPGHRIIITKLKTDGAHICLKPIYLLGQICSIFPVNGVLSPSIHKLRFTWKSWRIIYFTIIWSGFVFCTVLSFKKALNSNIVLQQLISPLYYLSCVVTSAAFLRLAKKWPKFLKSWTAVESHMDKQYTPCPNLKRTIYLTTAAAILIALIERCLVTLNFIYSKNCENSYYGAEYYLRKQFHFVFGFYDYNVFCGFILLILSWIGTYVWSFPDLFIIILSLIVATRLKQFTARIKTNLENLQPGAPLEENVRFIKKQDLKFWKEIREDFDKLTDLCHDLDDLLADLVVVSYSSNLAFILVQLFISLREMNSLIEGVYFFFSFGFVIIRTVVVSIYGSMINEESLAPLPLLHSLPSEAYNSEAQRLITQIQLDTVALTGHNFFRITKGLVLNVAAAIITYELVLIQFNQTTLEKYSLTNNDTVCF